MWKNYNVTEEILEEDGNDETSTIIMEEWNSVVRDKSYQNIAGPYILGRRKQTGQMHINLNERNGPSPIHNLRSLREVCTPGKHQEIEINISLTIYL